MVRQPCRIDSWQPPFRTAGSTSGPEGTVCLKRETVKAAGSRRAARARRTARAQRSPGASYALHLATLPVAARSRCVRLASVWRQGYPSPAYSKQFAVFAGHRLVAECFNFLRGDAGPAHRLDHMIDDAKVVAGRVKRDADVGMFGGHFKSPSCTGPP
jgi:hypothetical protein